MKKKYFMDSIYVFFSVSTRLQSLVIQLNIGIGIAVKVFC